MPDVTSSGTPMKAVALLLLATCVPLAAYAADDTKPLTKQQSKMATCNKDAKDLKGDERKAFMKDCLSKHETQQARMKRCNTEAKGKAGNERKAFMSECLKGSPGA